MNNVIKAAMPNKIIFTRKKLALFSYPSHKVAKMPDNLLPNDVLKNQPPIITAVMRFGLNLDTKESPIGLKNNSPMVIIP